MLNIKEIAQKGLVLAALLLCKMQLAIAQSAASSESVYSDQKFDPAANEMWYNSPVIWAGGVILVGAVILLIARKNRKYT
jgi:hypothetical protein